MNEWARPFCCKTTNRSGLMDSYCGEIIGRLWETKTLDSEFRLSWNLKHINKCHLQKKNIIAWLDVQRNTVVLEPTKLWESFSVRDVPGTGTGAESNRRIQVSISRMSCSNKEEGGCFWKSSGGPIKYDLEEEKEFKVLIVVERTIELVPFQTTRISGSNCNLEIAVGKLWLAFRLVNNISFQISNA